MTQMNPVSAGNITQPPASLSFNQLMLNIPDTPLTVWFSKKPGAGMHRFATNELPPPLLEQLPFKQMPEYLHAQFKADHRLPAITFRPSGCVQLARAFYTLRIREILAKQTAAHRRHHLYDTRFWCETGNSNRELPYHTLERFTLKLISSRNLRKWKLQIGYDGPAYPLRQSLQKLGKHPCDTRMFREFLFRHQVYRWHQQPREAGYHPDEVFPVLTPEAAEWLGIPCPAVSIDEVCAGTFAQINRFASRFNLTNVLEEAGLTAGTFRKAKARAAGIIGNADHPLQFGEGHTCSNPRNGLQLYGPAVRPDGAHFSYFIICFSQNKKEAELLDLYIAGKEPLLSVRHLTRLPLVHRYEFDIELPSEDEAMETFAIRLAKSRYDLNVQWIGLFITPCAPSCASPLLNTLFNHIKEQLLFRGIPIQGVQPDTLNNMNPEILPGIAGAIIQKLGGIPWQLSNSNKNRLVIGLVKHPVVRPENRFTGAIACRSAAGIFQELDYFIPLEKNASKVFISRMLAHRNDDADPLEQLVIHTNLRPVDQDPDVLQKVMAEHGYKIPVIIIGVRLAHPGDALAFYSNGSHCQPRDGTWVHTGRNTWLLYAGGTVGTAEKVYRPLHLTFSYSGEKTGTPEQELELLEELYAYTRLSCNPCLHPPIPATIHYPLRLVTYLARIKGDFALKANLRKPFFV